MQNPHTPVEQLQPQQEIVRRVTEIYDGVEAPPPPRGVAVRWSRQIGGPERLYAILDELAGSGHLQKPHSYVFKVIKRLSEEAPGEQTGSRAGLDDRRRQQAAALGRRSGR